MHFWEQTGKIAGREGGRRGSVSALSAKLPPEADGAPCFVCVCGEGAFNFPSPGPRSVTFVADYFLLSRCYFTFVHAPPSLSVLRAESGAFRSALGCFGGSAFSRGIREVDAAPCQA